MSINSIYNRTNELKDKLNKLIQNFTSSDIDYFEELTQAELIDLKLALSDVNNVLTLKTTLACSEWLSSFFDLEQSEKDEIDRQVNSVKPNTNGYDIEVNGKHKIVVEIKCIVPINNGNYYGAAQRNSILDDAIKLKSGKKVISDTSEFYKIIGLIDLGEKTDRAIEKLMTPAKKIRTSSAIRLKRHDVVSSLKVIDDSMCLDDLNVENIYIKKISI
jgi:HPt (histidine-containing phosphotransfer) domain-containing protein